MQSWPWQPSQSGRWKQDVGPKANFKKQQVKLPEAWRCVSRGVGVIISSSHLFSLLGWAMPNVLTLIYTPACGMHSAGLSGFVISGPFWLSSFSTLPFGLTSSSEDTWQGFPSWSHELLQAMQEKTTTLETFDAVLGLHLAISTICRPFLCRNGDLQIASQTGKTRQRRIRSQLGMGS